VVVGIFTTVNEKEVSVGPSGQPFDAVRQLRGG
jgi:hypothetical protein